MSADRQSPTAASRVLDMRVDITSVGDATERVLAWAQADAPRGRYVCVSNVHMCMEVHDDGAYRDVVNGADLVVPDGRPLVWAQRLLGKSSAQHVRGTDLTLSVCRRAAELGVKVGFYGGAPDVLDEMREALVAELPTLEIAIAISPPFRALTAEEDAADVAHIERSGARILFVGLGCPKQERWMAAHRDRLGCAMLGVGAAFDFIAGRKAHAPRWMQAAGLEWTFRLATEPRRLWRRYARHNPRFVGHFARQYARERLASWGVREHE